MTRFEAARRLGGALARFPPKWVRFGDEEARQPRKVRAFPGSREPGKALGVAALVVFAASPTAAHDFWIQPAAFEPKPQTTVALTLQVGHGQFRQRSPVRPSRITRFSVTPPEGPVVDERGLLHLGAAGSDGDLRVQRPGLYVLVLETDNHAESHLPAIRFNDYLKVEGLTPALEERSRTGRTDVDGSEVYSRHAKALMLVGPPGAGSQADATRPVGMPLEIVPELSPYVQPQPKSLPVRILFEGRPLAGALVKLTNLEHDESPFEMRRTDRNGRAVFSMPSRGSWLLNVIWTKRLPASRSTDFEAFFSSLSFGFSADGP